MKRLYKILVLVLIMLYSLIICLEASDIGEMDIIINDGFIKNSPKTQLINDTYYVPLSKLQENLGVKIYFKEADNGYHIYWWNNFLYINNDKTTIKINGEYKSLDQPVELVDDVLYIPTDMLVNIFGFKIEIINSINCYRIITKDDVKSTESLIKIKEEQSKPKAQATKETANQYKGPKTAYITFDDGIVRGNTNKILDILKEKNVKATFFVLGNTIKNNQDILKRIAEEGHSIGNHSYSHKKEEVYKSSDALMNEINKTAALIKEVVGKALKLFRPPYGSNVIKEKSYQEALKDYKIVLWNVDSNDSRVKDIKAEQIFNNVVDQVKNKRTAIILFHDTKSESIKALPWVIDYLIENGFEIKPITEDTIISYK